MSFKEYNPESEKDWLELRSKVLTATEVGTILGLNPWKSVKQLIEGKKHKVPIDNSYIWLGQKLEPVVVDATNKLLGTEYKLYEDVSRSFFADTELGLGATPDAWDGKTLLECKTTKPGNYLRWHEWPPAYYLAQLYTQLICTDFQEGYLAILGADMTQLNEVLTLQLHVHKLERSEEMDKMFLDTIKDFWAAEKEGKVYRVNRKRAPILEIQLRLLTRRVYG